MKNEGHNTSPGNIFCEIAILVIDIVIVVGLVIIWVNGCS